MKLAQLLSDMIANGASLDEVKAVVLAARQQDEERASGGISLFEAEYGIKQSAWYELRGQVVRRDGYACRYCSTPVGDDFHCDHVMPLSQGGASSIENLVVSCRECNSSKAGRTPQQWRAARGH